MTLYLWEQDTQGKPTCFDDPTSPPNGLRGDKKPGDVNGQGFYDWYAISPSGEAVTNAPSG